MATIVETQSEVYAKPEFQRKVAVSKNSLLEDLYLKIAKLENELDEARQQVQALLYPNHHERLLKNKFKIYVHYSRSGPLSLATVKNYGVTAQLMERTFPGIRVEGLTEQKLNGLRDNLVGKGDKNSTVGKHFIQLKAILNHFQEEVGPDLDLRYLKKGQAGEVINDKPVIFLRAHCFSGTLVEAIPCKAIL